MQFPDSPRVIYNRNPLAAVTCQFNFPPILQIDKEVPAAFQERIRHQYPVLQESRGISLPQEIPSAIGSQLNFGNATYQFRDDVPEKTVWMVSLTRDALSFTTSEYHRWEDFTERLVIPLQAFIEVYSPSFFSRVGLRYQNLILRSVLGIENIPWKELLTPQIAGILTTIEDEKDIEQGYTQIVLKLDTNRKVLFQHGFGTQQGNPERGYIIDNDFYTDTRTEVLDARSTLDSLNKTSGRLFHWCINDRLHTALEPVPVP